ncbi:phosphatidylinositide phosphatase spermathreecae isoform X2 [Oratosquilla oratoria]|uniref:phosphatidylinositide phosphatase spermathreecae isoform X2 n=1 Tax=Oratosquilla oratoria TaxID=337810 RepID=UPI003F76ABA8
MELLQTEKYYIFNKGQDSLWCDRKSGKWEAKTCWDLAAAINPVCLGIVHGLVGKIQIHADIEPRLLIVAGAREVGNLADNYPVFCITRIIFLPLSGPFDCELNLRPCHKHTSYSSGAERKLPFGDLQQKVALSKTFGTIRNVTSSLRTATVNAAVSATGQKGRARRDGRDKERYEKRVLDELSKMFNESNSFYFSFEGDLTNSLQRQSSETYNLDLPLWKRADDQFFWNKHMLHELIDENDPLFDPWIVPVIQGFVQVETVPLEMVGETRLLSPDDEMNKKKDAYTLSLISRRSRHRAGTRYKRRGVDESGRVANYVETEQIISFSHHRVAFLQVRGSVPVYWSQPGYKYRPPPRLDKDTTETAAAFTKHFEEEVVRFGQVVCVNLVAQTGKEKVIADAYLNNILTLDSPHLIFVTFDFHEYCRGMRFENVAILMESLHDIINKMLYCWVDKEGVICCQNGIFRVNCMDCLDRTNVVQTAIAKSVLESQFVKLGMLPPESPLPPICRSVLQIMWANNGDIISKQYAGTSALKGDFTRTGERKFTGMMKDGVNSANRYYMNRFKDAYRQATIDHMLGIPITEDMIVYNPELAGEDEEHSMSPEHVKHVIDDCKNLLVPDAETILGAWGLIDADPSMGDPDQIDMDIILVLTRDSYYVAQYDDESDIIPRYERVSLIDLEKIEIGPYTCQTVFKQSRPYQCIRFNYLVDGQAGYFHMFRSMNVRFFNNMAVTIKSEEEMIESVKAIGETFEVAVQMIGCEVQLLSGKLEKKRSRGRSQLTNPLHLLSPITSLTKTSPDSIKNAGTRAFNNVTSGLAKLNPMAGLKLRRPSAGPEQNSAAAFYIQKPEVHVHSEVDSKERSQESSLHLPSCGILMSSIHTVMHTPVVTSPLVHCFSEGDIRSVSFSQRSATPEILVSGVEAAKEVPPEGMPVPQSPIMASLGALSPSLFMQRVRKLSHSSDEVDQRGMQCEDSVQRASSSAQDLTLQLSTSHSDGQVGIAGEIMEPGSNPLSPLSALNKENMLAPFSRLAKGVQFLAPGATNRFARGVQSIGANLDPRRLRSNRQRVSQVDVDPIMKQRKLDCKTRIIEL